MNDTFDDFFTVEHDPSKEAAMLAFLEGEEFKALIRKHRPNYDLSYLSNKVRLFDPPGSGCTYVVMPRNQYRDLMTIIGGLMDTSITPEAKPHLSKPAPVRMLVDGKKGKGTWKTYLEGLLDKSTKKHPISGRMGEDLSVAQLDHLNDFIHLCGFKRLAWGYEHEL